MRIRNKMQGLSFVDWITDEQKNEKEKWPKFNGRERQKRQRIRQSLKRDGEY